MPAESTRTLLVKDWDIQCHNFESHMIESLASSYKSKNMY